MSQPSYEEHRDYFSRDHHGETLDQLAENYLRLTRALHYKHERLEDDLRYLIEFLRSRGVTRPEQLTPEIALDYQSSLLDGLSSWTYNNRLDAGKRLCEHLLRLGLLDTNPFQGIPRLQDPHLIPYIFPVEELARIFECKLGHDLHAVAPNPSYPRRDFVKFCHYCAYHTLYACGLRISELTNLDLDDVDFSERTFSIRDSKFGKDRIIPFNDKVRRNLEAYLELRAQRFPHTDAPALFLSSKGRGHQPGNIRAGFRKVLDKLDIYHPSRLLDGVVYMSPRLHSLRHSFAVHRLLRWYSRGLGTRREGADLHEKLPLLSTYMGHQNVHNTFVYLPEASPRSRDAAGRGRPPPSQ